MAGGFFRESRCDPLFRLPGFLWIERPMTHIFRQARHIGELPFYFSGFGIEPAMNKREEIICMQYLVFAIGAGAIVPLGAKVYKLFERWNGRRRLRGAQECLDAVHNTLAGLAECNARTIKLDDRRSGQVTRD
jgi:hypothetical protein